MVIWSTIIGIVLPALGSIIFFDDGLTLEQVGHNGNP